MRIDWPSERAAGDVGPAEPVDPAGDHRVGGLGGDSVQVATEDGPRVCRVDGLEDIGDVEGIDRAGGLLLEIGHVLLLNDQVVAGLPASRLTLLTTRTTGLPADRAMTAACWDLDEIVTTCDDFVRWLCARLPGYQAPQLDSRAAFAERIRLIDVYRHATRNDPLLPLELQPPGWAGEEAHRLFREAHDRENVDRGVRRSLGIGQRGSLLRAEVRG